MKVGKPFLAAKNGFEPVNIIFVVHDLFEGTVLDFDNLDIFFTRESFYLCSLDFRENPAYRGWRLKNVNKSSYL